MESKEDKFEKIIQAAFGLAGRHGVENTSISMLSRSTGISRGWIYKYIASDIEGVLRFCLKSYAEEFARFGDLEVHENPDSLKRSLLSFSEALAKRVSRDALVLSVYFRHISSNDLIGDVVREADDRYLQHLASNMAKAYKIDESAALMRAKLFHSMRMGGLLAFTDGEKQCNEEWIKNYITFLSRLLDEL